MGLEAVFFLEALVLLTALIYGVLSYRHRNRALDRVAEDVTRGRYQKRRDLAEFLHDRRQRHRIRQAGMIGFSRCWHVKPSSPRYRSALCQARASSYA